MTGNRWIGAPAPEVDLDLLAHTQSEGIGKDNHLLLYFLRSFQCVSGQDEIRRLAEHYPVLQELGARVIVIGPGHPEEADALRRELDVPFPILADVDGKIYRAFSYGRRNLPTAICSIQQSGTVLIDREGVVQHIRRSLNPMDPFDDGGLWETLRELP